MEQIIITHRDGTTLPLRSKERVSSISKAAQKTALLSDDVVTVTVTSAVPLDLQIGDTARIYGKPYKLNQLPEPTIDGNRNFTYEIRLEGLQYDLIDVHYHLPEDAYGETFYADLAEHLRVVMWNINRIFPGKWTLGEVPTDTEYKNITNSEKNALQVLQELCDEYGVEFSISTNGTNHTLDIKKQVGVTHPFTLEFGRGKGLYQLSRKNVNNAGVTTRVYYYGGSDNLGRNYGHTKLCLNGTSRLTSYLEDKNAIALYGIREGEKVFSDIKPQRIGTVTTLGKDVITFADASMFDLNAKDTDGKSTKYLIQGTNAKIKFETGQLAGYEFDLHSYDHDTHTFVINKFTDENGLVFPSADSAAFQIAEGDKYSISDINLPEDYIIMAEEQLNEEANKHLPTVSQPQVSYKLALTEGFFIAVWGKEVETEVLHVGDFIQIKDSRIGVDKAVRITQIDRDVLRPHTYDVTLSDTVTKSTTVRVLNDIKNINETITANKLADPAKARRRWMATQELLNMVFDPDGDYYSEKIKPLSIETTMLSVGAKSQQFTLRNITFQANYNGDPNTLHISSGQLVHYAIWDGGIKQFTMAETTISDLNSDTPYYIYARCMRTGAVGTFLLSNSAKKVDSDANYYCFLVGVLNSVVTDEDGSRPARLVSLTYGSSTVNGRFIRTGRIESNAGSCWFDLDNNEIGGVIKFVSNDGTVKDVADVEDKADEAKDYIDNTLPEVLGDIQAQLDGQIEQWFEDYDPTSENEPTSLWIEADEAAGNKAEREKHLGDLFYNTDTGKVYRYVKKQGARRFGAPITYTYLWQQLTDSEVAQALALANDALSLASTKRRIFTSTPYTPYEVGDLWVQGANGDIMRCKTARDTGSYTASDWEKASKYTDNTALTTFINGQFATTVAAAQKQIDGKIESWFQTSDPASSWTTDTTRAKHVGDMWYNTDTHTLKRYSTAYEWETIEDQKAIDAYIKASKAQDTADGKRRVFVAQPTSPYDIGDLWLREWDDNGVTRKDLFRCITARVQGEAYKLADWAEATYYDNTQTTIDGGIVTAGTVQLANGTSQSIVAGITGGEQEAATAPEDQKVRIWAGASKANRFSAPFRVLQNGKVFATDAEISGKVNATSGTIGGFTIDANSIRGTQGRTFAVGSDDFNVNLGISESTKRIAVQSSDNLPIVLEQTFRYKENNRYTLKNNTTKRNDWKNIGVANAMFIDYFASTKAHEEVDGYGFQYAMAGTGHIAMDAIVEGAGLTFIDEFTSHNQVTMINPPFHCNRIAVRSSYDNSVLALPCKQAIFDLLGFGFLHNKEKKFSFKLTIINVGSKVIYIAGRNSDNRLSGTPYNTNEMPLLHWYDGTPADHTLNGLRVEPRMVANILLVYHPDVGYTAYHMA